MSPSPRQFAGRLRYLQDDLQPRNGLEGLLIERLAGDLWKADRAEGSAGARISFRLWHGPVDQAIKETDEAIELGQYLLWQPAFPLRVGLNEGEVKGALGAVAPGARRPSQLDPSHPTLVTEQGVDPQPPEQHETAAAHARTDQGKTTASIAAKTADAGTDSENIGHGLEARATHVVESAATVPKAENASPIADVGEARGTGLDLADPFGETRRLTMATTQGSAPENLGQVSAQGSCGETTCDGSTILGHWSLVIGHWPLSPGS